MCGILGVIAEGLSAHKFKRALNSLEHRGPDAIGYKYIQKYNLFFGHRRLSILDISKTGKQPMYSSCGNYLITFNGEIYNFEELKSLLPKRYQYVKSDTRILVELIAEIGLKNALKNLDGMFAFAVLDIKRNVISIARDPFGEKPLYYFQAKGNFVVSSELKPVINLFKNKLSLNRYAISEFLRYSYVPNRHTIFQELNQLSPGCFAEISLTSFNNVKEQVYWSPSKITEKSSISFSDAINEFECVFKSSVSRRCISDAPLGAFLSGGYDSTAVVATMIELGLEKVKTFTIGFEEDNFNEAPFAKKIAQYLGTEHTELYVPSSDAFDIIPDLAKIYDEPFADVSQIPTYLLSQLTRKHVTVALSGDGGDELFAGYSRYVVGNQLWNKLNRLPMPVRKLAVPLVSETTLSIAEKINRFLPKRRQIKNITERSKKIARILACESREEFYDNLTTHEVSPEDLLNIEFSPFKASNQKFGKNFISGMMHRDLLNYLPCDILTKVDRASMANSLEARTPFLSKKLYEFSQKVPFNFLYSGKEGKIILKDYVHKRVPRDLVDRPKMGFGVPISSWLKSDLKPWMLDVLNSRDIQDRGIFQVGAINGLISDHLNGKGNKHNSLWNVIVLCQWLQEYNFSA